MNDESILNTGLAKWMAWSGVVLVLGLLVSQGWLMGFIPPPSPALSAQEIAQIFIDRKFNILLGTLIQCVTYSFYLTWAMSIVFCLRKMERGMPIITYTSIANAGGGYVLFMLMPITWAALAFRPEALDPTVLQFVNTFTWFVFILSWPPFAIFMVQIAIAVLRDHNTPSIYPRWVGYFNLWVAVLVAPAGLIEFFTTGPFAYDGIISFWMVWLAFFGWMCVMTIVTLRALHAEEQRLQAAKVG